MDREYAVQNDIVERYLRGKLSAEDSTVIGDPGRPDSVKLL
jgi:hypothetical protein